MSLVYKDSNGDPIDITNWCARLTWKNIVLIPRKYLVADNIDKILYMILILKVAWQE
jgi:hypothetical protein